MSASMEPSACLRIFPGIIIAVPSLRSRPSLSELGEMATVGDLVLSEEFAAGVADLITPTVGDTFAATALELMAAPVMELFAAPVGEVDAMGVTAG